MSFYLMHRGWMENDAFRGEPYGMRTAWMWLIENAAWQPTTIRIDRQQVELDRGELSFSERFLADKWKWSRSRVHRFLIDLTTFGMIRLRNSPVKKSDHQKDHPQNILTLCNYNQYQDIGTISEPRIEPSTNHLRTISEPKNNKGTRKEEDSEAIASGAGAPQTDPVKELWDRGKAVLGQSSASLIGKARREHGDLVVMRAVVACETARPSQPVEFFLGCLKQYGGKHGRLSPAAGIYAGFADALGDGSPDSELDRSVIVPLLGNGRA